MSRTLLTSAIALATIVTASSPLLAAFTPRDSALFSAKFEMNDVSEGLNPATSTAQWTRGPGGSGSQPLSGGTLLYDTSSSEGASLYYEAAAATWANNTVINADPVPSPGWTLEVRVRVNTAKDDTGAVVYQPPNGATQTTINDRAFQLVVGDGVTTAYFNVGLSSVTTSAFGGTLVSTSANNNDYHVFRIAKEGGLNIQSYRAWRDDVPLTELGSLDFATGFQQDNLYFVDGTGAFSGSGVVDYIRFDFTGGYSPAVPEPASASLLAIGATFVLRRRRK